MEKRRIRFFLLLIPIFLLACQNKSLTDTSEYFLLEDQSLSLSPEQAWKFFQEGKFSRQTTHSYNPGFTTSDYWMVVDLKPSPRDRCLEIGTSQINEIDYYTFRGDVPTRQFETGDYLTYSSRPISSLNFVFPIPHDETKVLLRISKRNESLQLTFLVRDVVEYHHQATESSLIMGLMTGAIVLMLIFGIFLFGINREKVYLFYTLYITAAWLYVVANQGYGYMYLWPDNPWFAGRARPVALLLTIAFSLHFIEFYIGKVTTRWITISMEALKYFAYLLFILFLIPGIESKASRFGYVMQALLPVMAGIYIVTLITALIQKLMNKNRMALFYLSSLLPIIFFSVLQISYYSGGLDFSGSYLQHFGQATGMVMEAIILTFGLAYRFNTYRKEKEELLVNLNRQQARYARAIITTQESERRQLADQLHDVAGSLLSAARLNLSAVREKNFITNEDGRTKLASAEQAVSDISNMLRNLSHAISPVMLDKVGFRQAVEKIVGIFNASGKIIFELDILGFEKQNPAMYEKYSILYSILYELMNNIVKHARASHALIQLVEHDDCLVLIIEDNGIGLDPDRARTSETHGLAAIRSKIHYLQGHVTLDQAVPKGLIVTIEIPKTNDETHIGG